MTVGVYAGIVRIVGSSRTYMALFRVGFNFPLKRALSGGSMALPKPPTVADDGIWGSYSVMNKGFLGNGFTEWQREGVSRQQWWTVGGISFVEPSPLPSSQLISSHSYPSSHRQPSMDWLVFCRRIVPGGSALFAVGAEGLTSL